MYYINEGKRDILLIPKFNNIKIIQDRGVYYRI